MTNQNKKPQTVETGPVRAEVARNFERNQEVIKDLVRQEAEGANQDREGVASDRIDVGGTAPLYIPQETLDDDPTLAGVEVATPSQILKKFRRPHRRYWIQINPHSEYQTLLIENVPQEDSPEREFYWVAPHLRRHVESELKQIRIFMAWSLRSKDFAPWPIKATVGNSWYESLARLLKRPNEEFERFEFKIVGDQSANRYHIRRRPISVQIEWPEVDMGTLLAEVVGEANFITDENHPFYCDLIGGEEL